MNDLHVHLWPHRPGTPPPTLGRLEQYCEQSAAKGVAQIAITEHSHRFERIIDDVIPHWERSTTGPCAQATDRVIEAERGGDLDHYVETLVAAQDRGLPILVGLEVDYWPGAMEAMAEVLDDYPFDILLGSVHWLDDWLFDAYDNDAFGPRWQTSDLDKVYEDYVDAVLDLAHSGLVDVLAHIDVIKVAGHRPESLAHHEARLVEGLTGADVAVELSSAGLRKPAGELYPSANLFRRLVAAGARFTTASDAHQPDQIGEGFDALANALRHHGITELVTFSHRQPIHHPTVLG